MDVRTAGSQVQGITLHLSDVVLHDTKPQVTFTVTMNVDTIQSPSDGDGELFNQQLGQEILKQLIHQLQGVPHG